VLKHTTTTTTTTTTTKSALESSRAVEKKKQQQQQETGILTRPIILKVLIVLKKVCLRVPDLVSVEKNKGCYFVFYGWFCKIVHGIDYDTPARRAGKADNDDLNCHHRRLLGQGPACERTGQAGRSIFVGIHCWSMYRLFSIPFKPSVPLPVSIICIHLQFSSSFMFSAKWRRSEPV